MTGGPTLLAAGEVNVMKNTITFDVEPKSRQIDSAGDPGIRFLKYQGFSDDKIRVAVMIIRELIKSSMRYGQIPPATRQISVSIHVGHDNFTIEVSNPMNAACDDRLRELDKIIQFIRSYQDPFEPYAIARRNVSYDGCIGEPRALNLARIAYEGNALLDFFVSEDNTLNLTAVGNLKGAGDL